MSVAESEHLSHGTANHWTFLSIVAGSSLLSRFNLGENWLPVLGELQAKEKGGAPIHEH